MCHRQRHKLEDHGALEVEVLRVSTLCSTSAAHSSTVGKMTISEEHHDRDDDSEEDADDNDELGCDAFRLLDNLPLSQSNGENNVVFLKDDDV